MESYNLKQKHLIDFHGWNQLLSETNLEKTLFPLDQVDEKVESRIQEYRNRRVGLVKSNLDNKEILS